MGRHLLGTAATVDPVGGMGAGDVVTLSPAAMGVVALVIVLVAVAAATAWRHAVRIDRLHLALLATRRTLETQLERRAHLARELALAGALPPPAAVVLADAASSCLALADVPLLDDGLDSAGRDDPPPDAEVGGVPRAGDAESRGSGSGSGSGNGNGNESGGAGTGAGGRSEAETRLAAVLGEVLDDDGRSALSADPRAARTVEALDAAAFRITVLRGVHETRVHQVHRARRPHIVRILHLAGRAPLPQSLPAPGDARPASEDPRRKE